MNKDFWNDKYKAAAFAYGEKPNDFLKEQLQQLQPGKILFPCDGEGRNSVYAATLGWEASAFDLSEEGKNKALLLAEKNNVSINYEVAPLDKVHYQPASFDAIALIYAHFPAADRHQYHRILDGFLRPGGVIILEGFSKNHVRHQAINQRAGGPKDVSMLFTVDDIRQDFSNYEAIELYETETELHEGLYHEGAASVIRFVGKKI